MSVPSSSAGTCASRPIPVSPSAMLKTTSQRSPATSRAASARMLPIALDAEAEADQRRLDRRRWSSSVSNSAVSSAVAHGEIVVAQVVGDPDAHGVTPQLGGRDQPAHGPVRAERAVRIGIAVDAALEVAQQQIVAVAADDRIGHQRDLAAAARRVDRQSRHRIARGVAAQRRDDLEPLLDRRAEMRRAGDRVALIEVVGLHPAHQQPVHQPLHHRDIVVDALEQHGLAAERDAGIGQPRRGFGDLRRQLVGMGEVHAHPERMMLAQHPRQAPRSRAAAARPAPWCRCARTRCA